MYTTALPRVDLVQHIGSDELIAAAARVSTGSEQQDGVPQLINYLMKHRHGSPFEHGLLTFRIECPIFVAREFMRHRIGWSYNERSGRYAELDGHCWMPDALRPLVNSGSSARPLFERGSSAQRELVVNQFAEAYIAAEHAYRAMLEGGIAYEIARSVLPVGLFTEFYATCNPRSLMHFLSLRIDDADNTYETYPLEEIQDVAVRLEEFLAHHFPATHRAFVRNGRVAP